MISRTGGPNRMQRLIVVGAIALSSFWGWLWTAEVVADMPEIQTLEPEMVHLRSGQVVEWSEFRDAPQGTQLECRFGSQPTASEITLRLRQQDVKQSWRVMLNDRSLGDLIQDENDMVVYFPVAPGTLIDGENVLRIEPRSRSDATSDDIRVGQLSIEFRPVADMLQEAFVSIRVEDAEQHAAIPCRLTILDQNGALQPVGVTPSERLAVRIGTIYTASGEAHFGLPAGRYTIFAGRGFEYSLQRLQVRVAAGQTARHTLAIRREVPTAGYVACDTHVHTLTHSGHGDATIAERMVTLAGEGIELPIATDHNVQVDYEPVARQTGVRQYFTPVTGNEFTTSVGHFNIFPVASGEPPPDYRKTDWSEIFDQIFRVAGARVAILNHARDRHSGVRPFGPKLHNSVAGDNLHRWPMRFNAMEVVNSSATQSDDLQLFHDWMALLNHGYQVTPVGSSDSHDVSRHFVGQGRTYIRCPDSEPGRLDVQSAVDSFLEGQVLVSYGLIADISIAGRFRPGDLVPRSDLPVTDRGVPVELRVLGPHWTSVDRIDLYSNGTLVRSQQLPPSRLPELPAGVHWQDTWYLPLPRQDVHLVAIAMGPGITAPYWRTAKPYQPTSPEWNPRVIGCSGALWLDADGDGQRTAAVEYARRAVGDSGEDWGKLFAALGNFDEATAIQAAHLCQRSGWSLQSEAAQAALAGASPHVKIGFGKYLQAWAECQRAQVEDAE